MMEYLLTHCENIYTNTVSWMGRRITALQERCVAPCAIGLLTAMTAYIVAGLPVEICHACYNCLPHVQGKAQQSHPREIYSQTKAGLKESITVQTSHTGTTHFSNEAATHEEMHTSYNSGYDKKEKEVTESDSELEPSSSSQEFRNKENYLHSFSAESQRQNREENMKKNDKEALFQSETETKSTESKGNTSCKIQTDFAVHAASSTSSSSVQGKLSAHKKRQTWNDQPNDEYASKGDDILASQKRGYEVKPFRLSAQNRICVMCTNEEKLMQMASLLLQLQQSGQISSIIDVVRKRLTVVLSISEDDFQDAELIFLIAVPEPRNMLISGSEPSQLGAIYREACKLKKNIFMVYTDTSYKDKLKDTQAYHASLSDLLTSQKAIGDLARRNKFISVKYKPGKSIQNINKTQTKMIVNWINESSSMGR